MTIKNSDLYDAVKGKFYIFQSHVILHNNLLLSTELLVLIGQPKEFQKLMFQALAPLQLPSPNYLKLTVKFFIKPKVHKFTFQANSL